MRKYWRSIQSLKNQKKKEMFIILVKVSTLHLRPQKDIWNKNYFHQVPPNIFPKRKWLNLGLVLEPKEKKKKKDWKKVDSKNHRQNGNFNQQKVESLRKRKYQKVGKQRVAKDQE